jgi:cell division protein FtsZ
MGLNDVPHPSLRGIKHRLLIPEDELNAVATLDDMVARGLETDAERLIARELIGFDMVVVVAGLGGHIGGDGANAVARVARLHNIPTWGIVTQPFRAEGLRRRMASQDSLDRLRRRCPGVLAFTNDELLEIAPDIPIMKAFAIMGQIMVKPLEAMSKLITKSDIRLLHEFFAGCRELRLGIGEASGPHRSFESVTDAFASPWMKFEVEGTRQAMILVSGAEIDERLLKDVMHNVALRAPIADVLYGSYAEGQGDMIRVSVMVPPP